MSVKDKPSSVPSSLPRSLSSLSCSICLETLRLPKCLPCIHTFCLACLEQHGSGQQPGDRMACPLCRAQYIIPLEGFRGLPTNYLLQELLDGVASGGSLPPGGVEGTREGSLQGGGCEACESGAAWGYCLECDQHLCKPCRAMHAKLRATSSHRVLSIEEKESAGLGGAQGRSSYCDVHRSEQLKLYCYDCSEALCLMCSVLNHKLHRCEDLNEAAAKCARQIKSGYPRLERGAEAKWSWVKQLDAYKETFLMQTHAIELEIAKKAEELQKFLNTQCNLLLKQLDEFKTKRLKEIQTLKDEIEVQLMRVESLRSHVERVTEKGTACDVVRRAAGIVSQTEDLVKALNNVKDVKLEQVRMKFTPASVAMSWSSGTELIGQLALNEESVLVAVGLNVGPKEVGSLMVQQVCRVSVEHADSVRAMGGTPACVQGASAACVLDRALYLVGVGVGRREVWRLDPPGAAWTQCGSMEMGRYGHCVGVVGKSLYAVGGLLDGGDTVRADVVSYSKDTNEWSDGGHLDLAVHSATCLAYKKCIYVFGGVTKDRMATNQVQVYDVINRSARASKAMPEACAMLRAVLWENRAIVVGQSTCFIYDLETGAVQERGQFKTGLVHFGLVLHNKTLYIAGGGLTQMSAFVCKDEVKRVALTDVLDNKGTWGLHARLPQAACIQAYGLLTL